MIAPAPSRFKKLRLLIVDNNPFERELLTFVFEEEGAQVIAVDCVDKAIVVIECFRPHLLISEINLPRKSGYSLLLQIRSNKSKQIAQTPAIALTTAVMPKDRQLIQVAGFNKYVSKPTNLDDLLDVVSIFWQN